MVDYYLVNVIDGEATIQDPDGLIYDIGWKSVDDPQLNMAFPEDRDFLQQLRVQQYDHHS